MNLHDLKDTIDAAFERRAALTDKDIENEVRPAVNVVLSALESGKLRVAEPDAGAWIVHEWIKKAVLLSFRIEPNQLMPGEPAPYFDKVPLRYEGFDASAFRAAGSRVVPGAIVRRGTYLGKDFGLRGGQKLMAQAGKRCVDRVGKVCLQLAPDPWHQAQIPGFARNQTQSGKNAQNPQGPLCA